MSNKPFSENKFSDKKKSPTAFSLAGLTPPHSLEAEKGLLAACLLDPAEIISRCLAQKLPAEAFYHPAHQLIFETCVNLFEHKSMLDPQVLAEELRSRGKLEEVGGLMYVADLTSHIETTAHANYFLDKVREHYTRRRLIKTASMSIERCFSAEHPDIEMLVDEIEKEIYSISDAQVADTTLPVKDAVVEAVSLVKRMIENKGELVGLSSGFVGIDNMLSGLKPTEMIVLAARPSMGKTSLALNIAERVSMSYKGKPAQAGTLVFSLEMGAEQLAMRLLTGRAQISVSRLRDGIVNQEEQEKIAAAAIELKDAPIWIDDGAQVTINQLRAKSRRVFARNKNMGLIVIDYLQLIAGSDPRMPREQQISEISRGIKGLAKELKVPVIVLSQLNRDSEKEKRQPKLSDLRESGSIEQDADVVLLLARPKDAGDDFSVAADKADLIVAKQRAGAVGEIKLNFIREITRFEDYTE
ncbi:replicative DNA helicase [Pelagicoccus sp. NFK12]|uniref:Replicative DNA helicase n=1 Tax=Pelagicoccus enzymogenes TaxID=2773457 RepID=A0A927F4E9_9BACT|nr:replicative DNA helicase [Pelagicoccus enzymogenes]MBD5778208.1 replicative DNA helicase [Pelagicoccus enzymogenes]MDQ8201141.1 replicative DNA helicase [Pelagicoccus enzymogenes]